MWLNRNSPCSGAGAVRLALSIVAPLALLGAAHAQVTFGGLGFLPGGSSLYSDTAGVSGDGSVVTGFSFSANGNEGYRWTAGNGMVGLGDLDGGFVQSNPWAVSTDGNVIVGSAAVPGGAAVQEAFRWTQATGMVSLGDLPGGIFAGEAYGVSADGTTVVGYDNSVNGWEAFRWRQGTGMVGIGDLPGGSFYSQAHGVSGDGAVIVGVGRNASSHTEAFRWTQGTGMVGLGVLPGGSGDSTAYAVTLDGTVVVGTSTSSNGTEAFRWTQATGMVGLGDIPGTVEGIAYSVSGDGNVVVGYDTSSPNFSQKAFLWTPSLGTVDLKNYLLTSFSGSLPGDFSQWSLTVATGVSTDGTTIVGYGTDPAGHTESWRVNKADGFGTAVGVAAPEPGSMALIGTSLVIGLAAARKRRIK